VIPVKTEPALASASSYTGDQGQQVATYEEENYTEYGEYEDQQGYTEAGMVDFNQSMDGNKDPLAVIEEQIQQNMYFSGDQWACSICGKSSKLKTDISRHIESIHVVNHPGYKCNVCDYVSKSRNALRQHRSSHHPN